MIRSATVVEVGPRDGFQMERTFIPTPLKIEVIDLLSRAGLSKIEVTSFVHSRIIPQMRDADEVMRGIRRMPGVSYTALVPNIKGAERAIAAQADGVRVVICASETYNRRNVGMSITNSLANCADIRRATQSTDIAPEAVIGLAFGCPLEGPVSESTVVHLACKLAGIGYTEISIADSVGLANPVQVKSMFKRLRMELPGVHFSLHVHNTRGLGLANVLAAMEEGVDSFDASLGGLGGCPVVPGATGNIATEDLVNMLEEMSIYTGIDVSRVLEASRVMQKFLARTLSSHVLSAGTTAQLYRQIANQRSNEPGPKTLRARE